MQLDFDKARRLFSEAVKQAATLGPDPEWERILAPALAAAQASNRTFVAALGTGILARATDRRADPYSIKLGPNPVPGAHNGRDLTKKVLAAEAIQLGVNLGVRGREPLNNQPFFRYNRMARDMTVHKKATRALKLLIDALDQVDATDEEGARTALRTFVALRRLVPDEFVPAEGGVPRSFVGLVDKIDAFLASGSEGGRKAQALAAGLLSAAHGPEVVVTSRVNDPDRRMAGDVGLFMADEPWRLYEVRDKLMEQHDILFFADKVVASGCARAIAIAVADGQKPLNSRQIDDWADGRGVVIGVIYSWASLARLCMFDSAVSEEEFVTKAYEEVGARLVELEVSEAGVRAWESP